MTTVEKEYLTIIIDTETAIVNNDLDKVKEIVERLSGCDVNEVLIADLNRILTNPMVPPNNDMEACKYMINNLSFIDDKEHKLSLIDLCSMFYKPNDEIKEWLHNHAIEKLNSLSSAYQFLYARHLIRLCSRVSDLEMMELIQKNVMGV